MNLETKRIVIDMDNNRFLTYQANFKDYETMLRMIQMILSVIDSQIRKQRLN